MAFPDIALTRLAAVASQDVEVMYCATKHGTSYDQHLRHVHNAEVYRTTISILRKAVVAESKGNVHKHKL